MRLTGFKKIHFGDWIIVVSCQENCLFRVTAYNSFTDSAIVIDKTYLAEEDAFNAMVEQLKSIMIGTEVNK